MIKRSTRALLYIEAVTVSLIIVLLVVIAFTPKLVRRVGAGLAQDLDLPAGRVIGELEPSSTDG